MAQELEGIKFVIDVTQTSQAAKQVESNFKRIEKASGDAQKKVRADAKAQARDLELVRSAVRRLFGAYALFRGARFFVTTMAEMEQLRIRLVNVAGGAQEGAAAFEAIKRLAVDTPFAIQQLTRAYIRLQAVGIQPTMELMTAFGDVAATFGKDVDQFAQAAIGVTVGETRRLREFGVVARLEADKVIFHYNGMQEAVNRNTNDIIKFLVRMGQTRFGGQMATQMDTLSGAWSNLGDAVTNLVDAIGRSGLTDMLTDLVKTTTALVERFERMQAARNQNRDAGLERRGLRAVDTGIFGFRMIVPNDAPMIDKILQDTFLGNAGEMFRQAVSGKPVQNLIPPKTAPAARVGRPPAVGFDVDESGRMLIMSQNQMREMDEWNRRVKEADAAVARNTETVKTHVEALGQWEQAIVDLNVSARNNFAADVVFGFGNALQTTFSGGLQAIQDFAAGSEDALKQWGVSVLRTIQQVINQMIALYVVQKLVGLIASAFGSPGNTASDLGANSATRFAAEGGTGLNLVGGTGGTQLLPSVFAPNGANFSALDFNQGGDFIVSGPASGFDLGGARRNRIRGHMTEQVSIRPIRSGSSLDGTGGGGTPITIVNNISALDAKSLDQKWLETFARQQQNVFASIARRANQDGRFRQSLTA